LKKKLRPRIEKDVESLLRNRMVECDLEPDGKGSLLERRKEELAQLRVELRGLEIAEDDLKKAYSIQIARLLKERQLFRGETLNYRFKKDELREAQAVLAKLQERMIALTTERSAPPRVILHEGAKVSNVPVNLPAYRLMAVAGLAAFCLPFVAGFLALVLWRLGQLVGKLEP
jgi:hypothetical protein